MVSKTFIDVLEELEKTTGTNDKIAILKKNKDVPYLKDYLQTILDKKITYGVAQLPEYDLMPGGCHFNIVLTLAEKLANRSLTGKAAESEIIDVLEHCTPRENKWYRNFLLKDLASIGMGQRIFEQGFEEKGFKFRLMLAESEEELEKIEDSAGYLDKKANGVCTIPRVEDGVLDIVYGGRNGLEATNFYFIKDELETLVKALGPEWASCVFHGEIHVNDVLEDTMSLYGFKFRTQDDFLGKNNKLKEKAWAAYQADEARILKFRDEAKFSIFEIIPADAWDAQKYDVVLEERKKFYLETVQPLIEKLGLKKIEIIETERCPNIDEGRAAAQRWIKRKFEGGIWKRDGGVYEWKRSRNSIKIKEVVDFEIEFDSYEIQKDKYNPDGTLKPPMVGKVWGHDLAGNQYKIGTGKALPEDVRIDMLENWETKYKGKIGTCSAQRPSEKGKYICARLDIIRLDRSSLED